MAYQDNNKKFIAVLNRKHPLPRLLNGVTHAALGLAPRINATEAEFMSYPNDQDGWDATLTRFPFIILEARNSGQLATLVKAAREGGIAHNIFTSSMIEGGTADEQVINTKAATGDALDYMVVTLFGDATALDPLTKKFSLFKDRDAAPLADVPAAA